MTRTVWWWNLAGIVAIGSLWTPRPFDVWVYWIGAALFAGSSAYWLWRHR